MKNKKTTLFFMTCSLDDDNSFENPIKEIIKFYASTYPKLYYLIQDENEDFNFYVYFPKVLEIDFDFAKSLHLFDCITPECFSSKSATGKELIKFLKTRCITFFVYMKMYQGVNKIDLSLQVSLEQLYPNFEKAKIKGDNYSRNES